MECGCIDGGSGGSCEYGEPILDADAREVKARRHWTCDECGEPIEPGETYELLTGECEGERLVMHTCQPCLRMLKDFCSCRGSLRDDIKLATGVDYVTGEINESWMGA